MTRTRLRISVQSSSECLVYLPVRLPLFGVAPHCVREKMRVSMSLTGTSSTQFIFTRKPRSSCGAS